MSHTATHTHVISHFANPYLRCDECGQPVDGYIDAPGHEEDGQLVPCRHLSGATSICPSWSPVSGCQCVEHLGHRDHPLEPEKV